MWRSILKFFVWLSIIMKAYYRWSAVYRWLFERKYKDVKIPLYQRISGISGFISQRKWMKDGWRTLGDAISWPGKLQWIGDHKMDGKILDSDCDDHSIYCVAAINKMIEKKLFKVMQGPHLCSVIWQEPKKLIPRGHNICVWQTTDSSWRWMSNWDKGRVMDGKSLEDIVRQCSGTNGRLLHHQRCNEKLELIDWSFYE